MGSQWVLMGSQWVLRLCIFGFSGGSQAGTPPLLSRLPFQVFEPISTFCRPGLVVRSRPSVSDAVRRVRVRIIMGERWSGTIPQSGPRLRPVG